MATKLKAPVDDLTTDFTRAIVTTRWGGSGYRPLTIKSIENYYVDTSLDNDTDPWYIEIGDPTGQYLEMLRRDNEVRVQIFGVGSRKNSLPVVTGVADDIVYNTEGLIQITGRDFSSLAVDSTAPPKQFRGVRAWSIVQQQARELGFRKVNLAHSSPESLMVKKAIYTDGSESYWDFWYRMYRHEKLWLWTEPDGTLMGHALNYKAKPLYYFGEPRKKDPRSRARFYIPVERAEIHKSTQSRVGEVWVYGSKGDRGIPVFVKDPATAGWIKRPRKIMLDATATSKRAAIKVAQEEIFEGKVGSVELRITIADPGYEIRQNQMCVLNLPDPGITGTYFVVGVRRQVGADGFVQEVRLRERNYAITNRQPADPQLRQSQSPRGSLQETDLNASLLGAVDAPQDWMAHFVKAAQKWHGPWDYNLFLATLFGICRQETNFQNERSNGHPGGDHVIWYPWKPKDGLVAGEAKFGQGSATTDNEGRTKAEWQEAFRNEIGGTDWAVGPMQLLTRSFKEKADGMLSGHGTDQFGGGRWVPEYNIMVAAEVLRSSLKQIANDSGRDIDIWPGVAAYEKGVQGARDAGLDTPYSRAVHGYVMTDPGYLNIVTGARKDAASTFKQQQGEPILDIGETSGGGTGTKNSVSALRQLSMLEWASNVDVVHVNFKLLRNVNSLAASLGRKITITSGYRPAGMPTDGPGAAGAYGGAVGGDTQWYLYTRYKNSGFQTRYIAAFPPGNHGAGEAVDCEIGGVPIKLAVSSSVLAQYGLHGTVSGDNPHITLIGVTG